jgi:hypothetical protein
MLIVLAGFTRYTSDVWESYPKIVEAAATRAPTSARAQQQYALNLYNDKEYDASLRVIDAAIEHIPDDVKLVVFRSTVLCNVGLLTDAEFEQMKRKVSVSVFDPRSMKLYGTLVRAVTDQKCPDVSLASLRGFFTEMLNVPMNGDQRSLRYHYIKYIIGQLDVAMHEPALAVKNFHDSLKARPGASQTMNMAALLATNEYYDEALYFSEIALAELDAGKVGVFDASMVSKRDVIEFRESIRLEIEAMSERVEPEVNAEE